MCGSVYTGKCHQSCFLWDSNLPTHFPPCLGFLEGRLGFFNCVICEVFDGVVQITGERAKQKEFFEDQKWLFILLSDPICCHGNRLLLTCVVGWFASISSERSFD